MLFDHGGESAPVIGTDHVAACEPQAIGRVHAEWRSGEAVAEPGTTPTEGTKPRANAFGGAGEPDKVARVRSSGADQAQRLQTDNVSRQGYGKAVTAGRATRVAKERRIHEARRVETGKA